jgi:DNA invertase Pin-like site-specific DNA recombinase
MGFRIVAVLREKISGTADQNDREGLNEALELARTGKIKKVLVHEVSRIARRNSIAHKFVESLEDYGVSLYWAAQSIETLLPSGRRNPAAGIMLALMAEMARNELEVLKMRVRSGIDEARRKGVTLGRPTGSTENLLEKHKDIVKLLRSGQSVRNTAKIAAKAVSTVQRVKKAWLSERNLVAA